MRPGEVNGASAAPAGAAVAAAVPVAVVGLGGIFPGADSVAAFYRDLLEGRDRLTDVPRTHWLREDYFDPRPGTPDKVYTARGGFVPDVELAPLELGLPPNLLAATDSSQLLALVVAKHVLGEATRGRWESMDRSRMSVVLGVASATELVAHMAGRLQIPVAERAMRAAGLDEGDVARVREVLEGCYVPWQESTFPGLLGNVVAGRIANRFDLGGTNTVVDAACASSLAAVDVAVNELALGRSDLVITGGVDTLNDILMFMCFAQTQALSPSGDCRPFADDADGTMLGEGVGMVALRRLADAERDGDAIYAVIRGIGSSSDGRAKSIYAPAPAGQAMALRRAYERAGYGPETVELVEAHGTGTKAGDAAELAALRAVFEAAGAPRRRCALGSVKSQIGHTKAAAGAAGLIKAVMALHHGVLPPTIKVKAPSAALGIEDSPFHLNTTARPWIRGADHPRRAAVSSFGFGGTNFHAALEEYRGPAPRPRRMRAMPSELVVLAADDAGSLADACRALARSGAGDELWRVARRTQLAFDAAAPARLAVVASDAAELAGKLAGAAELLGTGRASFSSPRGMHAGAGAAAGKAAFLFPGQGSQYVGMGGDLAIHFGAALAEWDVAASIDPRIAERAHPPAALDSGAAEQLARALTATEWAQPAIAATSLSMVRVLARFGLAPEMVGGHSLGEVTALGVAGVLEARDLVAVAQRRGELVAAAGTRAGAMIAVAADLETVEQLVARCDDAVIANHNAPAQVVVSGGVAAIEGLERALREAKIEARRIAVSTAFHSPLVAGACAPFRAHLEGVRIAAPRIPVYSNVSAAPYPEVPAAIRDQLAGAIAARVRFAEQLEAMYAAGARVFVEVGPSSVLTRLVGRCLADRPHVAVALDAPDRHGVTALWDALGRLASAGVGVDFARYWRDEADDERTTASSGFRVRVSGVNYGKPAPPAVAIPPAAIPASSISPVAGMGTATSPAAVPPVSMPPAADARTALLPAMPVGAGVLSPPGAAVGAIAESLIHAQMEYQRLMAESHMAFLRAFEAAHFSGAGAPRPVAHTASPVTYAAAPPPVAYAAAPSPVAASTSPVAAMSPAPVPPTHATPRDLEALLLAVVADKTGYPAEMIDTTMDLESDLGIDSIKRVEILAAIRERAPGLPEVEPAHMASLRTVRAIVGFLRDGANGPVNGPVNAATPDGAAPDGAMPDGAASAGVATARLVPCVVAAPAVGLAMPGLVGDRIAVTDDGGGVAHALVARLRGHGLEANVVDAVPEDAGAVVFLGGLREIASVDEVVAVHRAALESARAVAGRFQTRGGAFVTVEEIGGDFGLSGSAGDRAWLAGVGALAKTVAREWPRAAVRAIDIAREGRGAEAVAEALADELLGGGTELEVGLSSDGRRVAIATVEAPRRALGASPDRPAGRAIEAGAFFVVSGGARGVTAASLVALARRVRLRLLLLGRTALSDEPAAMRGLDEIELKRAALAEAQRTGQSTTPRDIASRVDGIAAAREVRETLRLLRDAGSEVRYEPVDIRDRAQVAAAIDGARRAWGPVRGVVHAAGVVSDALIADKTAAQLDRVMSTKVLGLRALLDATAADPIEWLCLFSSAAARTGNAGQADYAMANEILNKVAAVEARRRGDRCRVVSIGWGPWEGGMVTPPLRKHFAARGVGLLPLADGAAAFVDELQGGGAAEVVIARSAAPWAHDGRALAADVLVDRRRWPQLDSHRIQGKVVLPMAVVLEWFARLVRPLCRERGAIEFRDVRVLRAVTLARYAEGETERLRLTGQPGEDGASVAVELLGATGALHYAATLDLRPAASQAPARGFEAPREPWDGPALYGPSSLFHGIHFQVLRSIDGVSPDRARGTLASTGQAGWPGDGWQVDPAALDGALQLAFLFGLRGGGGPSLPMRIARLVVHRNGDAGPLRCDLTQRERTRERLLCDLSLASGAGEPVADLLGVEMFTVPSGSTAS